MLHNKDTKILSEINVFLASQEKAASKLIEVFRSLKLDKLSIVKVEFSQAKFRKSDLLLVLLLFPVYGIKNVHHYIGSKLQEMTLASKRGRWHLLGSTNTKLSVNQAYKIYSIRWSIEVFFKESKNYFAMGKSQSQDFDGQIADISIAMILYNLFSVLKKFNFYQTLGGIFLAVKQEITELTIWQKIWDLLLDFLKTFVSIVDGNFNEMVYKVLKSDAKDNEFIKLLELKLSRELK